MSPAGCFREEIENMKIWFLSHNFMTHLGSRTNTCEAQSRNVMNICTKCGFDILIISGSYGGHRRRTMDDGRWKMPGVRHKLPTGELMTLLHAMILTAIV